MAMGCAMWYLLKLQNTHKENDAYVTLTAVKPNSRFGDLEMNARGIVSKFAEKSPQNTGWINGGYMVVSPKVFQ